MLTDQERAEIEGHVACYLHRRAAAPEALGVVQAHRGWVSDEALADVADVLAMTTTELESLATAYTMIFRRPVGRHVILLCDSVSCWVMGYEKLLEHLRTRWGVGSGETTADERFTLLPTACLGACDHAPALMIDGVLYGDLTVEKLDRILEGLA
jgi:NADH-quinone oxidoreductase subunit E